MKKAVLCSWVLILACAAAAAANDAFRRGQEALAAKDYSTALPAFEAALAAEPDNMQYASEYRQAVIKAGQYDRCIKFFEKLVADHPKSANAYLNFGFAYVDKIPAAGSITQVILANTSLTQFSKSIEIQPSWIAYYTRGNAYLYWPKIFNRAPLGVADLEEAMKIQKADQKRSYHVRAYVALGDGYWKVDQLDKATVVWKEGLERFPDNAHLKARLSKEGDELKALLDDVYDPSKRVDTNLHELWTKQGKP
jgi:tetratricopeptide (TPR) repeat protein